MLPTLAAQPPSGGCVLKLCLFGFASSVKPQPPSGGCVLKPALEQGVDGNGFQPPSGGCVLKHGAGKRGSSKHRPAAFGRLCVETHYKWDLGLSVRQPPSGGCVLKPQKQYESLMKKGPSRLRAAVC